MLQEFLDKNPLLKVLIPLLIGVLLVFLGVRLVRPQLEYREQLQAEVQHHRDELDNLQGLAASIADINERELEAKLQVLKNDLGSGYYSPELIHFLEDIALETGIEINRYSIDDSQEQDLNQYQLSLSYTGSYSEILNFQQKLEDFGAYTSTGEIRLVGVIAKPKSIQGEAKFVITTIPEEYDQITESELPIRENPFQ